MNVTLKRDHKRKKLTEKTRKKISESRKKYLREHPEANRGETHPMFGKKHSKETREKMSKSRIGKHPTEETRKKKSESMKGENNPNYGKHWSEEIRKKMSEAQMGIGKGKILSEEHKRKISESHKGFKHTKESIKKMSESKKGKRMGKESSNWRGGISKLPYAFNFNEKLKKRIKKRDSYKCQICETLDDLSIHHVNYDKMNSDWNNLVTLCNSCHSKTNHKRDYWQKELSSMIKGKKRKRTVQRIFI